MIAINLQLAEDLATINADWVQFEQVIMNLAINARDAMPEGGTLTIETANVVLDQKFSEQNPEITPGNHVMLRIVDSGQGMDKDTLEHMFDPFFTTKATGKGTGLGLATVYGTIKNHKGIITCNSQQGKGTSFKIEIPIT